MENNHIVHSRVWKAYFFGLWALKCLWSEQEQFSGSLVLSCHQLPSVVTTFTSGRGNLGAPKPHLFQALGDTTAYKMAVNQQTFPHFHGEWNQGFTCKGSALRLQYAEEDNSLMMRTCLWSTPTPTAYETLSQHSQLTACTKPTHAGPWLAPTRTLFYRQCKQL